MGEYQSHNSQNGSDLENLMKTYKMKIEELMGENQELKESNERFLETIHNLKIEKSEIVMRSQLKSV